MRWPNEAIQDKPFEILPFIYIFYAELLYFLLSCFYFSIQVLLVRDELRSRRQLPQWSLYKGQRETLSFACKLLLSETLQTRRTAAPVTPFTPAGLRTATQKWRRTEETRTASKHHLPGPSLLCGAQSDHSNVGTWNWESKSTIFPWIFILIIIIVFFCKAVAETQFVLQTYSMSVYLVRQLTSPLLLQRLRMKGIRNPDHSRALSNSSVCHAAHEVLLTASMTVPEGFLLTWVNPFEFIAYTMLPVLQ